MSDAGTPATPWRLTLARACAWSLLLSGWIGLGALAMAITASMFTVYALVAAWLLALGFAAVVATRDSLRARARRLALLGCAVVTAGTLLGFAREGGLAVLLSALPGWAGLTALASGVVRGRRLAQPQRPGPPVAAAALGALAASAVLGDLGNAPGLALRLAAFVVTLAATLAWLQVADRPGNAPSRCRAGLFDCSLPAWPAGAWQDAQQWPTLLAGLAMLPMMAALPSMVAWCRSSGVPAEAMVSLHLAAMFAPALLLRRGVAQWPVRGLALACVLLLGGGAAAVIWARPPYGLIAVALLQGAAWSLAWAGQLWSPDRRGRQGSSPWRASLGYALLTLGVGALIDRFGPAGLAMSQAALGGAAALAWCYGQAGRQHAPHH